MLMYSYWNSDLLSVILLDSYGRSPILLVESINGPFKSFNHSYVQFPKGLFMFKVYMSS